MLTSWFENGGYSTVPLVRDVSWTALVHRLTSPPPATIRSWVCPTCDHRHSPRRWRSGRCPTCGGDLSPNKRDQPAWSPWTFDGPRSNATAVAAAAVGVEYDGTTSIEDIRRVWAPWTHAAHTTWSHTPESPRVRVVVALERPVTPTTWPGVWAALRAVDDRIDRKCSDPARLWFLPSTRPGVVFEGWSSEGARWPVGDEPGGGFAGQASTATGEAQLGATGEGLAGATDRPPAQATGEGLADATATRSMTATAHTCHVPGCAVPVPPKRLMCTSHWMRVPVALRRAVWDAYRPGQEVDKRPSPAWFQAAKEAIASVVHRPACPPDRRTYPLSDRYRTDPALRREVAGRTGAKIVGDRAKGATCPRCGKRSVWWYLNPAALRGCQCDHEHTCGWVGWLDQIDVRGAA